MFKRFLEMFFPGFSWEHGFALWDMGSAISAGASILGGMMGSDSAGDAADAQAASAEAAIKELLRIDKRTRSDTAPYRSLGESSANYLSHLLGVDPYSDALRNGGFTLNDLVQLDDEGNFIRNDALMALSPEYAKAYSLYDEWHRGAFGHSPNAYDGTGSFLADGQQGVLNELEKMGGLAKLNELAKARAEQMRATSGYGSLLDKFSAKDLARDVVYNTGLQFGLDEGNKAIERRASAFGNYDSGATLKALTRYANDYGTTKAEGAYARFMNDKNFTLGALSGGVTTGQNAVNTDAQTGANIAQAVAGAQMGAGNARAAGIVGGANAWGNALGNVGNIYNQYQTNQTLKTIFNPNA